MIHERSDKAWEAYAERSQKFDYFMVGLAAALAGFLGQQLELTPIGLNGSTLELLAVVLFGLSMVAGVKRIEWTVTLMAVNQKQLHQGEMAGALLKVAHGHGQALNEATGEMLSPGQALVRGQIHKDAGNVLDEHVNRIGARAEGAYAWRNWLLYGGMAALVASRLWQAYT